MKKKSHAAIAVALVTGGLVARSARAGLYSTPVANASLTYDATYNPYISGYGGFSYSYDDQLTQWYRVSTNEGWTLQSRNPVGNAPSGSIGYGYVQGGKNGYGVPTNGEIFQSIGTYTPNTSINIALLEGVVSGSGGNSLTVSIFSGGAPSFGSPSYYNSGPNYAGYNLSGATLLGSQIFSDGGTTNFNAQSLSINTGNNTGMLGQSLWLDFSINSNVATGGAIALTSVSVNASGGTAAAALKWNGSIGSTWTSSSSNFVNGSTPTAYSDGAAVTFDDTSASTAKTITLGTNVAPSSITFNNSSSNYTLQGSSSIVGGASLTKLGTGTLTITNANTFTGPVLVGAGVLNLQNANAMQWARDFTVASGATVQLQGYNLPSTQTPSSSTPWFLNGTGAAGQNGAVVSLGTSNSVYTEISLVTDTAFNVASGSTLTLSGQVGGSGALIKNGPGTLVLSYYNHYTGGTIVNGGILQLVVGGGGGSPAVTSQITINTGGTVQATVNDDVLGYNSASVPVVNINGGTFDNTTTQNQGYNTSWNLTGGSLTSTGGGAINIETSAGYGVTSLASSNSSIISAPLVIRGGTLFFTVAQGTTSNGIDLDVSGAISGGASGIDKEGAGTLALGGSDTFAGGVTINGGTVMLGDGTIGHDGSITGNDININNGATIAFNPYGSQTVDSNINGTGGLTKTGPGVTALTGQSNYSGPTNISAGKLYVNGGGIGTTPLVSVYPGATLGGSGPVYAPVTVASGGSIEGGFNGSGTLTVNSLTFNGSASVVVGTLADYGSQAPVSVTGLLTTAGSNTVTIKVSDLTGASTGTPYPVISYGTESGAGQNAYILSLPRGDAGSLSDSAGQVDVTLSNIASSPYLIWTGAANASAGWNTTTNNWTFSGVASTYIDNPGDMVIFDDTPGANQTVAIKSGDVHPTSVAFNNSAYTYTITGPNAIAGTTGITVNGTGTVILTNNNTFTGALLINSGTLQLGDGTSGHDGTIAAAVSITNNGTLAIDNYGPLTFTNSTTGTGVLNMNGSGAATLTGTISGAESLLVTGSGSVTSTVAVTGSGGVTMSGAGTLTLNGPNSYTGLTNVTSGTLVVNGGVGGAVYYNVSQGATLKLGYNTGGGYTGGIYLQGSGISSSAGLYIEGGIDFQTNKGLVIDTAPTTINTYGTGSATIQGFDVNTGPFLSTTAAASGTVLSPSINISTGSYGYNVATIAGANTSTGDLTIHGNIAGSGTNSPYSDGLVKTGTGSVRLDGINTFTTGIDIKAGSIIFASATAMPAFTILNVSSGAVAISANHGSGAKNNLLASPLSIAGASGAWTGLVDLNNNDMVARNGSIGTITNQLAQGYNEGNWNGTGGIISTAAANSASHLTALGAVANDNGTNSNTPLMTSFDGVTVSEADVLVKYTYYGDANLDGTVNSADYARIDGGFLSHGALTGWFNGDFNYDGVINGSDYTLIDNAFNTQGVTIASELALPTAQVAGGSSAVPEPASLGVLGIGAIGLLGRRRRRE